MIGRSVPRKEDERLVTGRGCYVDDVRVPGMLHVAFLRSMHAHARPQGCAARWTAITSTSESEFFGTDSRRRRVWVRRCSLFATPRKSPFAPGA